MSRFPRIEKRLLNPARRRRLRDGFSWIDRRFVREGFVERLGKDEVLLYFFLVAVADAHGLSYYGDSRLARTLQIPERELPGVRRRLVEADLLAYEAPLYQVLDLPAAPATERLGRTASVAEILRQVIGER